jgi:two-component system, OmpR family, sensor kinase
VLTFVILAAFAAVVGVFTTREVVGQFNDEVRTAADQLHQDLNKNLIFTNGKHPSLANCDRTVRLSDYASAEHAQIRIFDEATGQALCNQNDVKIKGVEAQPATPFFGSPPLANGMYTQAGYRAAVRELSAQPAHPLILLYARPLSDIDHTLAKVRFLLLLGIVGGSALALLAGLATAQRAMRPIVQLTEAAREIERTHDASRRLPRPEADDEVAELAITLEEMLGSLDAARSNIEAMLERQREFVADASHELRTPLTSVLANLELLAEELGGEQAESAQSALRSTRRMRRLVGDLLLLARTDARRAPQQRPTDLAQVVTEAAAELGPVAEQHHLSVDAEPALVSGNRDDLHRLVLNLLENAIRHTPAGTSVRAATTSDRSEAVLVVEDDGPGIPPEIERRAFDRFVRGGGDGGRGSGLGLAIVRAVAEAHGGGVTLGRLTDGGTRFVVRIPALARSSADDAQAAAGQTSTTTGSTIGRRRSRS